MSSMSSFDILQKPSSFRSTSVAMHSIPLSYLLSSSHSFPSNRINYFSCHIFQHTVMCIAVFSIWIKCVWMVCVCVWHPQLFICVWDFFLSSSFCVLFILKKQYALIHSHRHLNGISHGMNTWAIQSMFFFVWVCLSRILFYEFWIEWQCCINV